jgi:16S rRNA processing protein RimM
MPESRILMAVVGRPHGVRGLSHVQCYATDPAGLARYPLLDERGRQFRLRWQGEGVAELSQIVDGKRVRVSDRTAAEKLVNLRLYVDRDGLPAPDEDEFFLVDLIGLAAVAEDGRDLGRVNAVHDHGAGAYLEIGPHLVPFTRACVPAIDIEAGRLTLVLPEEVVGERSAA